MGKLYGTPAAPKLSLQTLSIHEYDLNWQPTKCPLIATPLITLVMALGWMEHLFVK
jgi:hypothetical protein